MDILKYIFYRVVIVTKDITLWRSGIFVWVSYNSLAARWSTMITPIVAILFTMSRMWEVKRKRERSEEENNEKTKEKDSKKQKKRKEKRVRKVKEMGVI